MTNRIEDAMDSDWTWLFDCFFYREIVFYNLDTT